MMDDKQLDAKLYERMVDLIMESNEDWKEKMMRALDGRYSEMRDENFVTPNAILVYDEASDTIIEMDLMDVPLNYPCRGEGARWSTLDLGEVVADKALLFRQSCIATEISDEDPEATPTCGTVVLCVPKGNGPYRRVGIKASINAVQ
jgi:hypothetical protein